MLLIVEMGLRVMGFLPGKIGYNPWFKEVEVLHNIDGFYTDSLGITKVDKAVYYNLDTKDDSYINDSIVAEIAMVKQHHEILLNNQINNSLAGLYKEIVSKEKWDAFDSLIIDYIYFPINGDGFYSIPFKNHNTNRKKILMLGDSFLYGHSAENFTSSFANELLAKGYYIYNTGISGADVTQYKAIAEQYIPIIQPDIVILNFFLGNDDSYYKRDVMPHIPLFFSTNAGNLLSFQYGIQSETAKQAYERVKAASYLPQNNLFAKTSTTTAFWMVLRKIGITDHFDFIESKAELDVPYCNIEIEQIDSLASFHNATLKTVVIPDYNNDKSDVSKFRHLLQNIDFVYSPVEKHSYTPDDGHFNTKGHKEYAEFLNLLINE